MTYSEGEPGTRRPGTDTNHASSHLVLGPNDERGDQGRAKKGTSWVRILRFSRVDQRPKGSEGQPYMEPVESVSMHDGRESVAM